MEQTLKKWGSYCLILGALLVGAANSAIFFDLVAETELIHSLVLWGHGFMAVGLVGFAASIMDNENRSMVMSGVFLTLFGSVLLGAVLGGLIYKSAGTMDATIEQIIGGTTLISINFMVAHFGFTVGLLVMLIAARGHSAYSNFSIYTLILACLLIGSGPFTSEMIFGIGFVFALVGGVWLGKELLDTAGSGTGTAERPDRPQASEFG